jgi:hypothetical protein
MFNFNARLIVAVFALCLSVLSVMATDSVELGLRWDEGAVYELSTTSDQVIEQTIAGRENKIEQNIIMNYTFSVQDVDDSGTATISIVYDAVKMQQKVSNGMAFSYDSTDKDAPVPAAVKGFAGLVGRGFDMKITPDGKVTDIQGVDSMIDGLVEGMDQVNPAMKSQMREAFNRQFGETAIRENMENMMGFYPQNPVAVGESWESEMRLTSAMPAEIKAKWILTERFDGKVRIDMASTVEPLEDAEPVNMGPMQLKYELSGEQKGYLILDEKTGWTEESEINQEFSGVIHAFNVPGAEESSTDWPMSIKGVLRTESKRVE